MNIDRINAERSVRVLSRLQMSSQISNVAEQWALYMRLTNKLAHRPNIAAAFAGAIGASRWNAGGENVGVGWDVAGLHAAFKASPTHWKNIIDARWNYAGIGVVYGSDGKLWTTHNFVRATVALPVSPRPPTATGAFTDVPNNSYYFKAVQWGAKRGITTGCSSTRFCPNDPVTRAQMITMLWRQAGSPSPAKRHTFRDVPANSFYDKAVSWAFARGITTGCATTRFCPHDPTIRAQAITFMWRLAGSPNP